MVTSQMLVNQKSSKEISSSQPQESDADYSVCPLFCCFVAELTSDAYQRLYTVQRQPQGLKRDGKIGPCPNPSLHKPTQGPNTTAPFKGSENHLRKTFTFKQGTHPNIPYTTYSHLFITQMLENPIPSQFGYPLSQIFYIKVRQLNQIKMSTQAYIHKIKKDREHNITHTISCQDMIIS